MIGSVHLTPRPRRRRAQDRGGLAQPRVDGADHRHDARAARTACATSVWAMGMSSARRAQVQRRLVERDDEAEAEHRPRMCPAAASRRRRRATQPAAPVADRRARPAGPRPVARSDRRRRRRASESPMPATGGTKSAAALRGSTRDPGIGVQAQPAERRQRARDQHGQRQPEIHAERRQRRSRPPVAPAACAGGRAVSAAGRSRCSTARRSCDRA